MILLDELVSYDETQAVAVTTIGEASLFLEPDGVPAHIGLEYMAQTCGAHAGALAQDQGAPVKIGFLLGTRQYRAHMPHFRRGDRLLVSVTAVYRDAVMGAFDCRIEIEGVLAAEARLTVHQPNQVQPLVQELGH